MWKYKDVIKYKYEISLTNKGREVCHTHQKPKQIVWYWIAAAEM